MQCFRHILLGIALSFLIIMKVNDIDSVPSAKVDQLYKAGLTDVRDTEMTKREHTAAVSSAKVNQLKLV